MIIPSLHPRPLQATFLFLFLAALAAVTPSSTQQTESIEFVQYDPSPSLLEEQPAGTLLTRFVVFYLNQNGDMRTDGTFSLSHLLQLPLIRVTPSLTGTVEVLELLCHCL